MDYAIAMSDIPDGLTPPVSASSAVMLPDDQLVPTGVPPAKTPALRTAAAPLMPWLPAVDWRLGGPPPLLGKAPTAARQLTFKPSVPVTRFTGPVLSGSKDEVAVGSAMLQLPLWVDWTMGSFSLPIQFQPGTMLIWVVQMAYSPWNGSQSASIALGTNQNGNQIIVPDGFEDIHLVKIRQVTGTLPFAIDPNPFQAWITLNSYGATAGSGVVLIGYARI
jgi:hypothetical protein